MSLDDIIIGAIMPLVPGVAITNSIRDMLAGTLVVRHGARAWKRF
jgi:uncharacterized membrane protein YjjP (DUF1212 family)